MRMVIKKLIKVLFKKNPIPYFSKVFYRYRKYPIYNAMWMYARHRIKQLSSWDRRLRGRS